MPVSHSHQFLWVSFRPAEPGDQNRIGGVRDIPDFMRLAAKAAQHVDRVAVALGQRLAVADAHHLRAAGLVLAFLPRDMPQIFRLRGIGDIDDGGAVGLGLAGLRIDRSRNVVGAAVMADIGDPAIALMMDGRLVGAARLQVAGSDQLHVGRFRRRADHLALRMGIAGAGDEGHAKNRCQLEPSGHDFFHPDCLNQSSLADGRRYHGQTGGNSAEPPIMLWSRGRRG